MNMTVVDAVCCLEGQLGYQLQCLRVTSPTWWSQGNQTRYLAPAIPRMGVPLDSGGS